MQRPITHRWFGAALALGLALAPAAAAADKPIREAAKEPPKTLLERMDRELIRARVQISNASARLRNRLVGVGAGESADSAPATAGMACCGNNVRRLRQATSEMARIHSELARCYRAEGQQGWETALQQAAEDTRQFARTVEAFAATETRAKAKAGIQGLTRDYLRLEESAKLLPPCPDEPGESPVEPVGSGGGEAGKGSGSR